MNAQWWAMDVPTFRGHLHEPHRFGSPSHHFDQPRQATADFNSDGLVGFSDVVVIVGGWGICPEQ